IEVGTTPGKAGLCRSLVRMETRAFIMPFYDREGSAQEDAPLDTRALALRWSNEPWRSSFGKPLPRIFPLSPIFTSRRGTRLIRRFRRSPPTKFENASGAMRFE